MEHMKKAMSVLRRGTVSNKKTHLAVFGTCVFRVYLRNHLSYKKVIFMYLHPRLKSFQIKKKFFKSGHKISCYLQKRSFASLMIFEPETCLYVSSVPKP